MGVLMGWRCSWWSLLRFWLGVWEDGRGLRGGVGARGGQGERSGGEMGEGVETGGGLWIEREKNRWGGGRRQRWGEEHGWWQRLIFLFLNLSLELDQRRWLNAIPEGTHLFSSDWEMVIGWWGDINNFKGSKKLTSKQFSQVAWDTSTRPWDASEELVKHIHCHSHTKSSEAYDVSSNIYCTLGVTMDKRKGLLMDTCKDSQSKQTCDMSIQLNQIKHSQIATL